MRTHQALIGHLIKYINPTWYFNLYNGIDNSNGMRTKPFPFENNLNQDGNYSDPIFNAADLTFQLINRGYTDINLNFDIKISDIKIDAFNHYLFIRRFYKKKWVWYLLLRRIMAWNNPFKELVAFIKSREQSKISIFNKPICQPEPNEFKKCSKDFNKGITIIIPTLNRYENLQDVLFDLEKQSYKNFEVIVVDQSEPFKPEFYDKFSLQIILIRQKEKLLWKARNEAIRASKYDWLIFFDDDSRVESEWIENHIRALIYFKADISAGVSLSVVGQKIPENYSYFRLADQFDSGNALVKKSVFKSTGLFDRQFDGMRMGDGEFGLRAYLHGFKSISNPLASRVHLKVDKGGLREMGSWDGFRPKKWFAPKPVPSIIYYYRKYFPLQNVREGIFLGVIMSLMPYRFKGNKVMTILSIILSLVGFPIICFQVWRSWKYASAMLKEGAKIDLLK